YSQGRILEKVPELAEGQVPHFPMLQRQLAAANRPADAKVTPVVRAGRVPGTTDIDLTVADKLPLHGSLELNNRRSPNTKPLRLVGSLRYDNLLQRDHSLTFQFQTAPQE